MGGTVRMDTCGGNGKDGHMWGETVRMDTCGGKRLGWTCVWGNGSDGHV